MLLVLKYDDIDDVIVWVNCFEYGLGGIVWGVDLVCVMVVVMWIDLGMVWVN